LVTGEQPANAKLAITAATAVLNSFCTFVPFC
jgi:hypothetical protein